MTTITVHYLALSAGVGPGNRGPLVPAPRQFESLEDAKVATIPEGHTAYVDTADGPYIYVTGQWLFCPAMVEHALTHRKITSNAGGTAVTASVVGPEGEWTVEDAGRLMISGRARFTYHGQLVTNLGMLPEASL